MPVRPEDKEHYQRWRKEVNQTLPHSGKNYRAGEGEDPLCPYCQLILHNSEDRGGFERQELYEAAKSGCEICDVLYQTITYFVRFVFLEFDMNRVWVRQTWTSSGRLLSDAKRHRSAFWGASR